MRFLRLLPRFRQAQSALDPLSQRESWSRANIEQYQLDSLNALWRHSIEHVPFYRELRASLQLPDRFTSLAEYSSNVPILPRNEVQSNSSRFLSERPERGKWKVSGGSTGLPTPFFWGHHAHRRVLHSKYRLQQMHGIDFLDPFVFLWGHTASFSPGLKGTIAKWIQPIQDWFRRRTRLSAYQLGADDLRAHLDRIESIQPKALYGYSTALYLLAIEAEKIGFRCDSLDAIFLTAEPTYDFILERARNGFGVPTVIEYGSAECEFIAGQAPDGTLRVREDVVFVETAPREDGHFDILISVLVNPSFPLLRYALGDVTDEPIAKPEQGFAILANVLGRHNDFVRSRSGRFIHPTWLMSIVGQTKGVRRYRIRQDGSGEVRVLLESEQDIPRDELTRVGSTITEALEGHPVDVSVIDKISQSLAGKHRWITSELTDYDWSDSLLTSTPVS